MASGRPRQQAGATRTAFDLTNKELEGLAVKLLEYVRFRARWQLGRLGFRGDELAFGCTCQDIVNMAMASLFDGRGWDATKHPDPFSHLLSAANSKLINMKSMVDRRAVLGEDFASAPDAELAAAQIVPPADDLVALSELHDAIETALLEADDADLVKLYDMAQDDRLDPTTIAQEFKISVREADNLKKRLRRLVTNVIASLNSDCNSEKGLADER